MSKEQYNREDGDKNPMRKVVIIFILMFFGAILLIILVNAQREGPSKSDVTNYDDFVDDAGTIPVSIINPLEANGGIAVNVKDKTTRPVDLFFLKRIEKDITLAQQGIIDKDWIIVSNAVNLTVGDYIGIFENNMNENIFYYGDVIAINGNNITLDSPLDYNYSVGARIIITTRNMNVNGATTCQKFSINGSNIEGQSIEITRLLIQIVTSTAPDLNKFGDITGGITNGIVLRRTDGKIENIFNVKTNGDLANLMYDVDFYDASNPGIGVYGLIGRYTFAGQDKHGVVIHLGNGDTLDLIICDDLTDFVSFRIVDAGHLALE